jgi:endoglucanase
MFLSTQLLACLVSISAFGTEVSAALLPERDSIPSLIYGRHEASNSSSSWPYGPFSTQGRDIVNTKGEAVTFAGVNWPGSGETMVPEGLEWASIEDILSQVKSVGFNFIRLTYAIEMVDQIYERNGSDVGLEITMINGLGYENG